jgi:hypothetical protein
MSPAIRQAIVSLLVLRACMAIVCFGAFAFAAAMGATFAAILWACLLVWHGWSALGEVELLKTKEKQ